MLIRKYLVTPENLPPATSPLVLIADMDVVVRTQTTAEMPMIKSDSPIPD